eukprot:2155123-Rhodomonas_salina.1
MPAAWFKPTPPLPPLSASTWSGYDSCPDTDAPRPHAEPAYCTQHPLLAHLTFLPHPRSRHD